MNSFNYGTVENRFEKQLATAYTVYMIFGSYFERCRMKNPMEEMHLRMHYMSMKAAEQYRKEEEMDLMSEELLTEEKVDDLYCLARGFQSKGVYCLDFRTGLIDFRAEIDGRGHVSIHRVALTL